MRLIHDHSIYHHHYNHDDDDDNIFIIYNNMIKIVDNDDGRWIYW